MPDPFDFFSTRDGLAIRFGTWRCSDPAPRGSVLLLTGRTEFMEKHAETICDLNMRRYDVYALDWRGQGLSDRLLPDRLKGHVNTYEDYVKDLEIFVRYLLRQKAVLPLMLLAHSMGGHIALRFLHDHPDTVERAVLVSPMIDIFSSRILRRFAQWTCRRKLDAGLSGHYVWGSGSFDATAASFHGNKLTSDPHRFSDQVKALEKNPDLALGGVTYGWLSATLASIRILGDPAYVREIRTPILMVGAGRDRIVSGRAQKKICNRLSRCKRICIPDARHEILKEADPIRAAFWHAFDAFTGPL